MVTTRNITKSLSNRAASRKKVKQNGAGSQKKEVVTTQEDYEEINVTYDMVVQAANYYYDLRDSGHKGTQENPKKLHVAKERFDRLKKFYHEKIRLDEWKEREERYKSLDFIFRPPDGLLVDYYLREKCLGKAMEDICPIDEISVYRYHPQRLTEMYPHTGEKVWYFFTICCRPNIFEPGTCHQGHWRTSGRQSAVIQQRKKVGRKQVLEYYEGDQKTKYKIIEYNLEPDEYDVYLCKLYEDGELCRCVEST